MASHEHATDVHLLKQRHATQISSLEQDNAALRKAPAQRSGDLDTQQRPVYEIESGGTRAFDELAAIQQPPSGGGKGAGGGKAAVAPRPGAKASEP